MLDFCFVAFTTQGKSRGGQDTLVSGYPLAKESRDHCIYMLLCNINTARCNRKDNEGYASICYESALLIVVTSRL
jgi:hypothetical protein